jgi:endo-1,4-beta-xylanase
MELTRRETLAGGIAVLASSNLQARTSDSGSLDAFARKSGRRFGSAVAWSPPGTDAGSFTNPAYASILERECSLLVPENQFKWQWIRRSPDTFDFRAFDAIADYAARHDFKLRGHTLFWTPTKWYPKWLAEHEFKSRAEAERLLVNHVETVCRRYGKRIYSYDVVNEAVQPETSQIRDTNVTRALGGEAFLDLMFHTARAAAPHAQLVYNDYMSWERGTEDETHIVGVLKLLEGFRTRGTPVDALGVQSHIRVLKEAPVADIVRESEGPWRRFLDEVIAMGYKLVITEFDVNDRMAPTAIGPRDQIVADYAKAYLDVMLSYPQLGDLLCWGMVDRYSWLNRFDPRADKTLKRGTPYDTNFQPKLLRTAMASAFASAASSGSQPAERG